jgi:hypothetical protein
VTAEQFTSRREVRESIRSKLTQLPRVDHNGVPIPDKAPSEVRPASDFIEVDGAPEAAGGAETRERARSLLVAPQGPQGDGTPTVAEPTFSEKNRAVALAAGLQIPYAEALDII